MKSESMQSATILSNLKGEISRIANKIQLAERITKDEGVWLFENAETATLGILATLVKQRISGDKVYFNRNFHIEPTNICIHTCLFCSYRRRINDAEAWEFSLEEISELAASHKDENITEVHIVGGVHPSRDIEYYCNLIRSVKAELPKVQIKAYTAVEIDQMSRKAGLSIKEGLLKLKEAGLVSIPGGGAEIFDEEIRSRIAPDKTSSAKWLEIHETAHSLKIPSNATILYGHLENYGHRIDHLNRLRELQDKTNGFNCFIPLKYHKSGNTMTEIPEVTQVEDMRNYAVSRIFLDNIPHLKAYWPMIGRDMAELSLSYGVDDLDGTIQDTTKIYSMAGSKEKNPAMQASELVDLIHKNNLIAIERDSLYKTIKIYRRK
jgi:aminodeoxyfutalosine synthase